LTEGADAARASLLLLHLFHVDEESSLLPRAWRTAVSSFPANRRRGRNGGVGFAALAHPWPTVERDGRPADTLRPFRMIPMDKEELRRIVDDPRLIPGIYNYCDRWCERCPFTSRCANFAIGEQHFADPEDRDLDNERFWVRLGEVFRLTLEMVRETAEEHGIDLDAVAQASEEAAPIREFPRDHECVRSAAAYAEMVNGWFESAEALWDAKREELVTQARLALPGAEPLEEAASLNDAIEVIRWYQYLIQVKLARAAAGQREELAELLEGFPKDSDGSAKVALIAMDRSMAAWGALLARFPNREREILDVLVHLTRLRRRTEEVFPDARAFVRPGFDDGSADEDQEPPDAAGQ